MLLKHSNSLIDCRYRVLDVIIVLAQDVDARENRHYNLILLEIMNGLCHGLVRRILCRLVNL